MIDTSWNPPVGGWSIEPQPVILPAVDSPAPTPLEELTYQHVPLGAASCMALGHKREGGADE